MSAVALLRDHLEQLNVPVLGGLPLGHGTAPLTMPHGAIATLDADAGILDFGDWAARSG